MYVEDFCADWQAFYGYINNVIDS